MPSNLQVCSALSEFARKDNVVETPESLFSYLIERVRNNLHIVLCMSPVGEPFRYTQVVFLAAHCVLIRLHNLFLLYLFFPSV